MHAVQDNLFMSHDSNNINMASPCCTWPPASVWRALFRKHYTHSSPSKWHQLYVDTSCVLLGLKAALLVDCVSPSAQKLSLFLKEVGQHGCLTRRDTGKGEEQDGGCHCDSAVKVDSLFLKEVAKHGGLTRRGSKGDSEVANVGSHFSECMSNCCILTIGEDTLLVNMECLSVNWSLKQQTEGDGSTEHAQLVSTCATLSQGESEGPVYVDVTKGLQKPKLLNDKDKSTVTCLFKQWLMKVYSLFLEADKTEIVIIPCQTSVHLCTSQQEVAGQTSPKQSDVYTPTTCGGDHQTSETFTNTVVELNLCTLFGQLLGYPVVYWFDIERGYSLDMVELVRYSVTVTSCDPGLSSDSSKISIDKEHLLYSFTVPKCLHLATCDQVKLWFVGVRERADRLRLVADVNENISCFASLAL